MGVGRLVGSRTPIFCKQQGKIRDILTQMKIAMLAGLVNVSVCCLVSHTFLECYTSRMCAS